jgi:glyoxylase-like metal-dependent hydrolase (beta-lactamase superfamily II)
VVLIDTGMHEPGSMAQLERAMDQVHLKVEHVRLLACTHAHSDHWGQAAPICERAGCELWLHPNYQHGARAADDPGAALARRLEVARQSGVSPAALERYAERFSKQSTSGVARVMTPDRPLIDGVEIETDLGTWTVYETPGHAPSHVSLFEPEHRLLISGDHVLGRISLYYDYGWSPDPVGEFLASLDVVDRLDARLGLSGHGRPFVDVHGHVEASRQLVHERLERLSQTLGSDPVAAIDLARQVHDGEALTEQNASWLLSETLCYLEHLERLDQAARAADGDTLMWTAAPTEP